MGDGGKWVCGLEHIQKKDKCVIYSFGETNFRSPANRGADLCFAASLGFFNRILIRLSICVLGINGESSFEAGLLEAAPGCEVWGYDFSVSGVSLPVAVLTVTTLTQLVPPQWGPELHSYSNRAHFEPWALGPIDNHGSNTNVPMWSLRKLMEHNGHDFIDVLKVDIEGAEFASLSTFFDFYESQPRPTSTSESPMDFTSSGARYDFAGHPLPIGQLQIELHPREAEESALISSDLLRGESADVVA